MDEKLFELISALIQTGGRTAIFALLIVYGTQVVKVVLGFGGVYLVAKILVLGGKDIARETKKGDA